MQLELTLDDIKWAIVQAKKLKIKQEVNRFLPLFGRPLNIPSLRTLLSFQNGIAFESMLMGLTSITG